MMSRLIAAGLALACLAAQAGPADGAAAQGGLPSALRHALAAHPSVLAKRAEVRAREAAAGAVRAQRLPSLSVQAQQGGSDASSSASSQTVRLRQTIWAFGRLDDAIALADADAGTERADLLRVQRQLLENTAVAYARVLTAQSRWQVGQDHLQSQEQWLAQIRRRERGELASAADVRLAVARHAQAVSQAQRLESEWLQAVEDLRALVIQPVALDVPLDEGLLQAIDMAALEDMVQWSGAEVRYREAQLARARAQLAQVQSSARPTVYAQLDRSTPGAGAERRSVRSSLVFEAALEGLGMATRDRTAEASARIDSAQEELRNARREAARLVRSHASNHRLLLLSLKAQQGSSEDLGLLLASYRRQYEAGTKTWLEVLNMQRELTEQRLQTAQAQGDAYAYALRLQALTAQLDALAGLTQDKP